MAISETKGILGSFFLIVGIYYLGVAVKVWWDDRRK
jgi:hypothetical protein